VTISGEIDIYSGPQLRDQLLDVIRRHGARLALDLTGVTFIDCAGINALLAARRRAQVEGGWLRVIRASPRVQRVIALTHLGPVLMPTPCHPNPSPRRRRRDACAADRAAADPAAPGLAAPGRLGGGLAGDRATVDGTQVVTWPTAGLTPGGVDMNGIPDDDNRADQRRAFSRPIVSGRSCPSPGSANQTAPLMVTGRNLQN
jgi:anti-sigma B factor antagonist